VGRRSRKSKGRRDREIRRGSGDRQGHGIPIKDLSLVDMKHGIKLDVIVRICDTPKYIVKSLASEAAVSIQLQQMLVGGNVN
jgi:hypothetical protein